MLERVEGPECPMCGCRDSAELGDGVSLWGKIATRRRCRHCATEWSESAAELAEYRLEYPLCRKCGARMLVVSTRGRIRYLKCSADDCSETGKSIRRQ